MRSGASVRSSACSVRIDEGKSRASRNESMSGQPLAGRGAGRSRPARAARRDSAARCCVGRCPRRRIARRRKAAPRALCRAYRLVLFRARYAACRSCRSGARCGSGMPRCRQTSERRWRPVERVGNEPGDATLRCTGVTAAPRRLQGAAGRFARGGVVMFAAGVALLLIAVRRRSFVMQRGVDYLEGARPGVVHAGKPTAMVARARAGTSAIMSSTTSVFIVRAR